MKNNYKVNDTIEVVFEEVVKVGKAKIYEISNEVVDDENCYFYKVKLIDKPSIELQETLLKFVTIDDNGFFYINEYEVCPCNIVID